MTSILASLTRWRKPQGSNTQILIFSSVAITDSTVVPQPPALPILSFRDMASNASTWLNAVDSGNKMQSETVDSDMVDRIGGAIKSGLAGGLGGAILCVCVCVTLGSTPVAWCVGASAAVFGAATGAVQGFLTKGN